MTFLGGFETKPSRFMKKKFRNIQYNKKCQFFKTDKFINKPNLHSTTYPKP
jgi:hypothetical protein